MHKRIGVYAGSFDPVHIGHITFAMQAIDEAKLDVVYFLPERRPRHKQGVEHYAHRLAMLRRATRPHRKLDVLDLVDISFTVERTLPKLQALYPGNQLVFLMGSDTVKHVSAWPHADRLLLTTELVVGVRASDTLAAVSDMVEDFSIQPRSLTLFHSFAADVSSSGVRAALRKQEKQRGVLESVAHYSNHHWLYVSLRAASSHT